MLRSLVTGGRSSSKFKYINYNNNIIVLNTNSCSQFLSCPAGSRTAANTASMFQSIGKRDCTQAEPGRSTTRW